MWNLIPFERRQRAMQNYFDDLERSFFGDLHSGFSAMRTDVIDRGESFELKCELPGFEKSDISLDIDGGVLVISAEHNSESENESSGYVRRERRSGSFRRSFGMKGIDTENISARYRNGVLSVDLPKEKQNAVSGKRIEIGE